MVFKAFYIQNIYKNETFKYLNNLNIYMETITINIDKETKELFKDTVKKEYGLRKGQLGRAVNEALLKWIDDKRKRNIAQRQLELMKKGFNLGFKGYKDRNELYERK